MRSLKSRLKNAAYGRPLSFCPSTNLQNFAWAHLSKWQLNWLKSESKSLYVPSQRIATWLSHDKHALGMLCCRMFNPIFFSRCVSSTIVTSNSWKWFLIYKTCLSGALTIHLYRSISFQLCQLKVVLREWQFECIVQLNLFA